MKSMPVLLTLTIVCSPAFSGEPKRVRFGDPLPEGAVARLGTLRNRLATGTAMAFLADGKTIRAVDFGLEVTEYDAADLKVLRSSKLPNSPTGDVKVQQLHLSRDGKLVVAPLSTGEVGIWDIAAKKLVRMLPKRQFPFQEFAISADNRTIATTTYAPPAYELRVWDVASGKSKLIGDHKNYVMRPTFFPDGKRLAAFYNHKLYCWDITTRKQLWSYPERGGFLDDAMSVSPDGQAVLLPAPRGAKNLIRLDVAEKVRATGVVVPGNGSITTFVFIDNQRVLIGRQGATGLTLFDLKSEKAIRLIADAFFILAIAPDKKSFVGAYPGGSTLQRWDLDTGKPLWSDTRELGHTGDVYRLAYSPDGRQLATSSEDGSVRIWDVATQQTKAIIREHPRGTWAMAFSPDNRFLFTSSNTEVIQWSAADGKEIRRFKVEPVQDSQIQQSIYSIAASIDRQVFAIVEASDSSGLKHFAIVTGWEFPTGNRLIRREEQFYGLAASFSDHAEVYAHNRGKILDTVSGRELASLQLAEGTNIDMFVWPKFAFSSSGQLIAGQLRQLARDQLGGSATFRGLEVWDCATGRSLRSFGQGLLGAMAMSPNGRLFAAADMRFLYVWDTLTGEELLKRPAPKRVRGHYTVSFVSAMAFSPDGRTLATGFPDSTVLLWEMPQPKAQPAADPKAAIGDLGSVDAGKAWSAVWGLIGSPAEAVKSLRESLKPIAPIPPERLKALLADLASPQFAKREAATKALSAIGERAEPALREALKGASAEQRQRIHALLSAAYNKPSASTLRYLRGINALEIIANKEAKTLLGELAKGDPAARETKAARGATFRLDHGP